MFTAMTAHHQNNSGRGEVGVHPIVLCLGVIDYDGVVGVIFLRCAPVWYATGLPSLGECPRITVMWVTVRVWSCVLKCKWGGPLLTTSWGCVLHWATSTYELNWCGCIAAPVVWVAVDLNSGLICRSRSLCFRVASTIPAFGCHCSFLVQCCGGLEYTASG